MPVIYFDAWVTIGFVDDGSDEFIPVSNYMYKAQSRQVQS